MERLLQTLTIDPVPHPERQIANDSGIVYVADGGVIQTAESLRLAQKPGSNGGIGVEVDPETDPALQNLVVRFEEDLLWCGGNGSLQPVATSQRRLSALKVPERLQGGQRSSPRRRSILTSPPQIAVLHHRRL